MNRSREISELGNETGHITWRRLHDESVLEGPLNRVFLKNSPYGGGFRNLWHLFQFQFFIFSELQKMRPGLIYAFDLDTMLPGLIWAKLHGGKIIYDQYDPYSSRIGSSRFKSLLERVEHQLAVFCDLRVTANIRRIHTGSRKLWLEVPNYFPFDISKNFVKSPNPILFYGGVLQHDRGLEYVSSTISSSHEWTFKIFGSGPLFSYLQNLAQTNKKIEVYQAVSHDDLMEIASKSHALVALYDPKFGHNIQTASNKLYEAVQLGIPIITSSKTYIGETVAQYDLGFVVDYGDYSQFDSVLKKLRGWKDSDYARLRINCGKFLEESLTLANSEVVSDHIRGYLQDGSL